MTYDIDIPIKSTQITWPAGKPLDGTKEHSGLDVLNHLLKDSEMETTHEAQPQQSRKQPTNLFDTKEQYLAFRKQWSKLAAEKKITSAMIIFYNLIRGKDLNRGFTPVTNKVKLENGARPNEAYNVSLSAVRYVALPKNRFAEDARVEFVRQFDNTINDEFMSKVANYLPQS